MDLKFPRIIPQIFVYDAKRSPLDLFGFFSRHHSWSSLSMYYVHIVSISSIWKFLCSIMFDLWKWWVKRLYECKSPVWKLDKLLLRLLNYFIGDCIFKKEFLLPRLFLLLNSLAQLWKLQATHYEGNNKRS